MLESRPAWMLADELLTSNDMSRVFEMDLEASDSVTHSIDVMLQVTWPEVGRASRIIERLDRELRRASRAWQDAYDAADQARDEAVFKSPERFARELARFPEPASTERGHLAIRDASVAPLTLLTEPVGEVYALLAQWPASGLTFALAAFGCEVQVCRWPAGRLESVMYADAAVRRRVYEEVLLGSWQGSDRGHQRTQSVAVPKSSLFRSVARHREEDGTSAGEISVLIMRHLYGERHDCTMLKVVMPQ